MGFLEFDIIKTTLQIRFAFKGAPPINASDVENVVLGKNGKPKKAPKSGRATATAKKKAMQNLDSGKSESAYS